MAGQLGNNNNNNNNNNMNVNGPAPTMHQRSPNNICTTKLEPLRLSQRWKIENFMTVMKLAKPGICLRSSVFRHQAFQDACWQLCLYPGGKRDENVGYVSLFLKMSATSAGKEVNLKAEYRFFFLDDREEPRFTNVNIGEFHAKPPKGGHSWGLRNIPRQKVQNSVREDGSLMIQCEVELLPDLNRVKCTPDKPCASNAADLVLLPRSFINNQANLLENGTHSDCQVGGGSNFLLLVVVSIDDKSFSAHKCILVARSEVFAAMFEHCEMAESSQNRIVIEDFTADAVHALLKYIYTGLHPDSGVLDDLSESLLGLAEKYGFAHLKGACEDHLAGKLDRGNVCQLLALADMYSAKTLKAACLNYLGPRQKDVLASEEWTELKDRSPKLCNEVLETLLQGACPSPSHTPLPKRQRLT